LRTWCSMSEFSLQRVDDQLWELPIGSRPGMRVPARVFADAELLSAIERDQSLEQLANVATLPGVLEAALAMPDIHQGYGFPVGGVAATESPDGVVSPGGVGYDINCGVRLLALPLTADELGRRREPLVHEISRQVPVGLGGKAAPARGSRDRQRAGAVVHRVGRLPRSRRSRSGLGAGPRARRRADRDARLRQSLPRASAGRPRL